MQGNFAYLRARQPSFTFAGPDQGDGPSGGGVTGGSIPGGAVSVTDVYYSIWGPQMSLSYLIYDFGTLRATSEASRQALYNADWTHSDAILVR
jgi:hypothetical protein